MIVVKICENGGASVGVHEGSVVVPGREVGEEDLLDDGDVGLKRGKEGRQYVRRKPWYVAVVAGRARTRLCSRAISRGVDR